MPRAVGDPPAVKLVWPTGEEFERAWLLALHDRGSDRTEDEEVEFRALAEKYGDPDLTIEVYGAFLALHAKNDERTYEETAQYRATGDRFRLHGRSELYQFDRKPLRAPCRPPRRGRAPRSRRIVRRVASRDGPARQSDDPPEPDLAPLCPRRGSGVVVLRGIRTCGACWAYYTLALEEWAA